MKKYLVTAFTLILSLGFVFGTPQANAAPVTGPEHVEIQNAPTTISHTAYFETYRGSTVFHSVSRNGALYRGYLSYKGNPYGLHVYSGKLYRSDLPYPTL